jgi:DNA-directed RNA polymerase specialized sigma24 family protein
VTARKPAEAIAEEPGLSVAAVKSRLHRARMLLRDSLAVTVADGPA